MVVKIEIPPEWKSFRMPVPLQNRLHELLDRQDREGKLPANERREAQALADLAEMLAFLKLQVKPKNGRTRK